LIPEDPEVVSSVSEQTGLSPKYVESHLTMSTEPETNILYARFSAGDRETAIAALRSLTHAIRISNDSAGSALSATVTPVSDPVLTGGFSRNKALLLGGLAGLAIATAIALTLERRKPRVDDLDDLAALLPIPVSLGARARLTSAEEMSGQTNPPSQAFVPVERVPAGSPALEPLFALVASRSLSDLPSGNSVGLLVARGTPASDVEERCRDAHASGTDVVAAFLAPHRRLRRLVVGRA
jgi:hypothetical protein